MIVICFYILTFFHYILTFFHYEMSLSLGIFFVLTPILTDANIASLLRITVYIVDEKISKLIERFYKGLFEPNF